MGNAFIRRHGLPVQIEEITEFPQCCGSIISNDPSSTNTAVNSLTGNAVYNASGVAISPTKSLDKYYLIFDGEEWSSSPDRGCYNLDTNNSITIYLYLKNGQSFRPTSVTNSGHVMSHTADATVKAYGGYGTSDLLATLTTKGTTSITTDNYYSIITIVIGPNTAETDVGELTFNGYWKH